MCSFVLKEERKTKPDKRRKYVLPQLLKSFLSTEFKLTVILTFLFSPIKHTHTTYPGIPYSTSKCPEPPPPNLQGLRSRNTKSPCHNSFLLPSSRSHVFLLWILMIFYLYLSWSLSLSGLYHSCLHVWDTTVQRKELLWAWESDLSGDGSQVLPSQGGWPWENTSSWGPPFFLANYKSISLSWWFWRREIVYIKHSAQ